MNQIKFIMAPTLITFDADNRIEYQETFKDGNRYLCTIIKYYQNRDFRPKNSISKIQYVKHFKWDKPHGMHTAWYDNGKQMYIHNYVDGVLQGPCMGWDRSGRRKYKYEIKPGKVIGKNKQIYKIYDGYYHWHSEDIGFGFTNSGFRNYQLIKNTTDTRAYEKWMRSVMDLECYKGQNSMGTIMP